MKIWNRVQSVLPGWLSATKTSDPDPGLQADHYLLAANENLKSLVGDTRIPASVRAELDSEFRQLQTLIDKLNGQEIHISVFGRVGVGKSSLLNALLGEQAFSTHALHGETRSEARRGWRRLESENVMLIDTPGIDEMDGRQREQLAHDVTQRSDLVLMVCEGDLTDVEFSAFLTLVQQNKPVLIVLNKSDRYTPGELELVLERLRQRTVAYIPGRHVIACAAEPRRERVIVVDETGQEHKRERSREPDVGQLQQVLWDILEKEGKTLAALNASIFAQHLDQQVASRIVRARESVAEQIIKRYCLTKSLLVAVNPVPVTDLIAAAGTDIAMVIHLGEVYGFRVNKRDATKLLLTISAQLVALLGAYWGVGLLSSTLKVASVGMSTVLTASAQGAFAWYATYVTGQMARSWFAKGKSWGEAGPGEIAETLLARLDRDTIMRTASEELTEKLRRMSAS